MITRDAGATEAFGRELAKGLRAGAVVALHGDLGSGKTTLAKGAVSALTGVASEQISSPTFTLMHLYDAPIPVYHFDLYRLASEKHFIDLGFADFLGGDGICLIEWPDKISAQLPQGTLHVYLSHLKEGERSIDV